LLGQVEDTTAVVVADLEAGIGTLTRMPEGAVDVVLVVVEPAAKSLEVGKRLVELAAHRGVAEVVTIANRVRDDDDLVVVRRALGDAEVAVVPYDDGVLEADRRGEAPLDRAPDAPAVRALEGLALRLVSAR
jgi:CO dehydrogenase maturation factor